MVSCRLLIFSKFEIYSEYQQRTVWTQIRLNDSFGPVWKCYQQTTLAAKELNSIVSIQAYGSDIIVCVDVLW